MRWKVLQNLRETARTHAVPILAFATAIGSWPLLTQFELFEHFYDFSRAHEEMELDELALLVLNLTAALTFTSIYQWRRLNLLNAERERLKQRAETNARHDPLTGLMNRRAFSGALEEIGQARPCRSDRIIAMMDLDRFKPVNDLYGHAAGDATLQAVARRIGTELDGNGQLARLGGDEFAVIFSEEVDARLAERMARRILHLMESPVEFGQSRIFVGCSIGLVSWRTDSPWSEALRRADKALYMSKSAGRGQVTWYDAELDRRSHERAAIEADLREAIAKSEIQPWFQPIIQIETGTLTGFEVLARWTHPVRGPIPPDVFIGIAEDSGQIGNLGFGLLREACQSARSWNPKLSISFNLSPFQFRDATLVEQIKQILEECGFDPARLTIEVTESSIIHDFDMARAKLDALKALGIKVALDDFGTGYSSLASLRKLPFDRIKIDRSFVTNIAAEPQNQKIVSGIMALANGLELDVTAEGIESETDLGFLQSLDCSLGQGFLFEKAIPADQIAWLLETKWSQGQVGPLHDVPAAPERQRDAG
ncbi:putative bifunctional diguanylate cyclase/phosphodiesterase [Mangrovicoccus ximenensis]|uniref:putative bifunctional diguanylate cyclase/phosphodiesterase n=1 Tax=Mangrovicoccus ximenensis TaxID=1911570 RepID=UPI000D37568D|nr:EAL domain-containing protein [Mangrovicoccus ximenensis]